MGQTSSFFICDTRITCGKTNTPEHTCHCAPVCSCCQSSCTQCKSFYRTTIRLIWVILDWCMPKGQRKILVFHKHCMTVTFLHLPIPPTKPKIWGNNFIITNHRFIRSTANWHYNESVVDSKWKTQFHSWSHPNPGTSCTHLLCWMNVVEDQIHRWILHNEGIIFSNLVVILSRSQNIWAFQMWSWETRILWVSCSHRNTHTHFCQNLPWWYSSDAVMIALSCKKRQESKTQTETHNL